jgi:hypothetical protein
MEKEIKLHFIDEAGKNKIQTTTTDKTITIHLQLAGESRKRKVGTITKSTKTFAISRKRSKHLFIKGNAYGFNEYILANAKLFDKIKLKDEFCEWKIPVQFILQKGSYLMFKQQGFEKQLFVSLSQIDEFKTKPNF